MSANQTKLVDKIISMRIDLDNYMRYIERLLKYAEDINLDNSTEATKIKLKQDIIAALVYVQNEHYGLHDELARKLFRLGVKL